MRIPLIIASVILTTILSVDSPSQERDRFHHVKSSPKVNYDSLLTAAVPIEKSSAGKTLVAECIRKYGGVDKLESLRSLELTYESTTKFGKESYTLVKSFKRGRRFRINRLGEERILNGNECWFQTSDNQLFLDQGRYKAELYSYLTLAMPLAIQTERFDSIRYGERRDDPLGYIYLDKQDSLLIVLGIDRNSYSIQTVEGIVRQIDQNFVFINKLSDYQQYEGFSLPTQVITISMGLEVSRKKLTKVKINPTFDTHRFKPRKRAATGDEL